MSTITSAKPRHISRQIAVAACCSLLALIAIPAAVVLVTEEADALLVLMPARGLLQEMPAGASILSWDDWSATIAAGGDGTIYDIYAAGALLVLPIRSRSCLNLS
jgi:hypothetical protein